MDFAGRSLSIVQNRARGIVLEGERRLVHRARQSRCIDARRTGLREMTQSASHAPRFARTTFYSPLCSPPLVFHSSLLLQPAAPISSMPRSKRPRLVAVSVAILVRREKKRFVCVFVCILFSDRVLPCFWWYHLSSSSLLSSLSSLSWSLSLSSSLSSSFSWSSPLSSLSSSSSSLSVVSSSVYSRSLPWSCIARAFSAGYFVAGKRYVPPSSSCARSFVSHRATNLYYTTHGHVELHEVEMCYGLRSEKEHVDCEGSGKGMRLCKSS